MLYEIDWRRGSIQRAFRLIAFFAVLGAGALFVGTPMAAAQVTVSFGSSGLNGESLNNPTSLQFGPDNRLYVSQQNGTIYAYNIVRNGANNYAVTQTEQINLVKNIPNYDDDGTPDGNSSRQVTGILVTGTTNNPILYVGSSDPRIGAGGGGNDSGLDTNSGVISKLTCTGGMDSNNECNSWDKVDLIRGLPRSEENHANNGMQIDETTNTLLIAQGGHANAGGPSNNFAYATEYALSAALLAADLTVLEALPTQTDGNGVAYKYNLPTLQNVSKTELLSNDNDHPDPWGGNDGLNQAMLDPNGPVQIFAPGFRNLYDIVITESGRIYGIDNGANGGWGGFPEYEESYDCTNNLLSGEPGSTGSGPNPATYPSSVTLHDGLNGTVASDNQPDSQVNNKNGLHLIYEGYYGGHPAPIRGNPAGAGLYLREGTGTSGDLVFYEPGNANLPASWPPVPVSEANPVECDFQNSGVDDGAFANFGPSTNGIAEYTASNFEGTLQGDLLAAGFNGDIYQIILNAAGDVATNCPSNPENNCDNDAVIFSGFGSSPLDVVALSDNQIFPGTIWAATYGADSITIFEPSDYGGDSPVVCTGADDPALDEDNDGYDNADEIDNEANPCSGGSKPSDKDGDFTSDLNDPDDDNDGLDDTVDHFQLDPNNGTTTNLPVIRDLFADIDTPPSFFGMGFSGIMANGSDYLTLIDDVDTSNGDARQLITGGTAGLFTDTEIGEGTANEANNSQKNAFQFGLDVDSSTSSFTIKARILGNFIGYPNDLDNNYDFAGHGIFVGTGDQDNYVSIMITDGGGSNHDGGIELGLETAGNANTTTTDIPGILDEVYIDLYLIVDPATGVVQGAYELESNQGVIVPLGSKTATGNLLAAMQGTYTVGGSPSALAVGVLATSTGSEASPFTGTWDYIYVTEDTPAELSISPNTIDFGSTLTGDSEVQTVQLTNTGGATASSVNVTDVSLTGADASEFDTNFSAPVVLAPGQTLDVEVTFTAGAIGNKTATLGVTHDGENSSPVTAAVTAQSVDAPQTLICINSGGPQYASADLGLTFEADQYFANGSVYTNGGAIANTNDDALFQTERFDGNMVYNIPVPANGSYIVDLYFAELYFGNVTGGTDSRVFDVIIEGNTVLNDYDIHADVGSLTAVSYTFAADVSDNSLDISFPASANNGKLSAICVSGGTGNGNVPPSVSPIANQSSFVGDDVAALGLAVSAIDSDGPQNLSYMATGLPAGVSLEPTNGQFFGTIAQGTAGVYNVTVDVSDGEDTTSIGFLWQVSSNDNACLTGQVIYRVNNGGPELAGTPVWTADQATTEARDTATTGTPSVYLDLSGSSAKDQTWGPNGFTISNSTGAPNNLFAQERYSTASNPNNMNWDFPVINGEYTVNLYFAESWSGAASPGVRVFDVQLEGVTVLENYDVYVAAGNNINTAVVESVNTTVSDGNLDLYFVKGNQNPAIKGIEVCGPSQGVTPPGITITQPANGATVVGEPVLLSWESVGDDLTPGVDHVHIYINTNVYEERISPFPLNDFTYEITGLPPGEHYVTVKIADANHQEYAGVEDTVVFTVEEAQVTPPGITITQPANGATIVGESVSLSWESVGDDLTPGVDHVHIYIDTDVFEERISPFPLNDFTYEITGLTPGEHYVTVKIADANHQEYAGVEDTVVFTVEEAPQLVEMCAGAEIAINAGGPDYTAGSGQLFVADTLFVNGQTYATSAAIDLTDDDTLFQTERYGGSGGGLLSYDIPVVNGNYIVELYFAEIYFGVSTSAGAGSRVFSAALDGTNVITDLDLFDSYGALTAVKQSFATVVDDGTIDLDFSASVNNAKVSAICVLADDPAANVSPTADAGTGQTVVDSDENGSEVVTLDGSGSTDSDGTIVSYVWNESGNEIATGVNPTVNLAVGTYTIELTVTDDDGATATDTVVFTVEVPANESPTADAGANQTVVDSDENGSEAVTLDGGGSTDSDGSIVSYVWNESGNEIATGVNPTVNLAVGTYTIELTVTDNDGATATDTVVITVEAPANVPPTADAGTDQTVVDSDGSGSEAVTLDGSGSTDNDGTIVSYVWNENGIEIATGVNPTVNLAVGTYTIELTVTDDDGATNVTTTTITVLPSPSAEEILYVSSSSGGNIAGVSFADEDILAYNITTDSWSTYLDGSDVGLSGAGARDIDAFHIMADGSILISVQGGTTVPDIGAIDDSDIVHFIPTSLGVNSAGTFEMYFDGSDVGLTTNGEDIDAIYLTEAGELILSTTGSTNAPGVSSLDEDLIRFTPVSLGVNTAGSWDLVFNGADVGLSGVGTEDTSGVWLDEATGTIYTIFRGAFEVSGVSGDQSDIVACAGATLGPDTSCTFTMFLSGADYGFSAERVDGFHIAR